MKKIEGKGIREKGGAGGEGDGVRRGWGEKGREKEGGEMRGSE